jgi:hypothetical protein
MNIPDKVKIGGFEYDIIKKDAVSTGTAVCFGTHSFQDLSIEISTLYPDQVQAATLIHEVLHALAYLNGVDLKESEVEVLGNALYAFIVDNPEVFKGHYRFDGTLT